MPEENRNPARLDRFRALVRRWLPLALAVLFAAALYFIHRDLREVHYKDVTRAVAAIPAAALLRALLFTALSYAALTGYDALGCRFAGVRIAYPKIALTSFLSYAFSNTVGFGAVSGGLVRYRIYSLFGVGAMESAAIGAFSAITFWAGLFSLGGVVMILEPMPWHGHVAGLGLRPLGFAFEAVFLAYLGFALGLRGRPLRIGGWERALPGPGLVGAQGLVSAADWMAAAAAFHALLPPALHVGLPRATAIFMAAQILSLLSNVPGGVGVFEALILLFIPHEGMRGALFGSLLAFRAVYYLAPLALGAGAFAGLEAWNGRAWLGKRLAWARDFAAPLAPGVSSIMVFLAGVVLLLSGSTRGLPHRLLWLDRVFPLAVMETSHFLASLCGIALLLLARGLQLRLDSAYHLAKWALGAGALLSMAKGMDFEEACVLLAIGLILIPGRPYFNRRASIREQNLPPIWIASIALALVAALWLGFFSYKHVEYDHELWWKFALEGNASRFLRAEAGVAGFLVLYGVWMATRAARPAAAVSAPGPAALDKAQSIARAHGSAYGHLALVGDKSLLFSANAKAFIMFSAAGRSFVAMGDPVGPEEEVPELIWAFKALCDRFASRMVFYQATQAHLPAYIDAGLSFLKLGEEAVLPLAGFSLEGNAFKGLRANYNRGVREGVGFAVLPPEEVSAVLPRLREISDSWLGEKGTREKGFSLGYFDEAYLRRCAVAVARVGGRIEAFANLWRCDSRQEVSLDLMRYGQGAPKGIMDFLFASVLAYGRDEGYARFNLGMAPLSGLENRELAPFWAKAASFLYEHGERFYNFRGLRQYKEKFAPVWEPRYLAAPGGIALPRVLANVTSLISGGLRGAVGK
jgi:phosphatidylglycerol lysyltransferase